MKIRKAGSAVNHAKPFPMGLIGIILIGMKRLSLFMAIILASCCLSAASVTGGSEVRPDLFYSEEELAKEDFHGPLTESEREYYEDTSIYLLTASPADPVYIYFGHSGLVIDTPDQDAVMYDWGNFSFSEGFYLNFVKGLLYYSISSGWAEGRCARFISDDRTVSLVPLSLSPEAKKAVMLFVSRNALPENRTYLYHYYKDNCATRIRDIYAEATDGDFRRWAESIETGMSYREWAELYLSPSLFFEYLLNYLEGPNIDEPLDLYQACFLPEILEDAISEYEGAERTVIYETKTREAVPESYSLEIRAAVIGIVLMVFPLLTLSRRRGIRCIGDLLSAIAEISLGIMSLILLAVMLFTNHDVTYWNINILVIPPTILISAALHLASLGKKERRKALWQSGFLTSFLLAIALLIQLITAFHQGNAAYYISMIPLYAAELVSARSWFRRSH